MIVKKITQKKTFQNVRNSFLIQIIHIFVKKKPMKETILTFSRVMSWLFIGTLFFVFRAKKIFEVFNYGILKSAPVYQKTAFLMMFLFTLFVNILCWWIVVLTVNF